MTIENVGKSAEERIRAIQEYTGYPSDLRVLPVRQGELSCLYLSSLSNAQAVEKAFCFFDRFGKQVFTVGNGQERNPQHYTDLKKAAEKLLEGIILFLNNSTGIYSLEVQGWVRRKPKEPETERLIRGPREGFTETLEDNIGMVRRWIRDPDLKVEEVRVGRRTKTRVTLMYLSDIAQPGLVKEVRRRIQAIGIDGLLEAGYIEQLITDRRASIFPLIQSTERSDRVAAAIFRNFSG